MNTKVGLIPCRPTYTIVRGAKKTKQTDVKQDEGIVKSGLFGLFKYSTKYDVFLMLLGAVCSCIQGLSMPILGLVFGQMTNVLMKVSTNPSVPESNINNSDILENITESLFLAANHTSLGNSTLSEDDLNREMNMFSIYYFIIGVASFGSSFMQNYLWETSCERQVFKLRQLFFSQVLRQEISWYDLKTEGDLSTKLTDDIERVREGIGHKCCLVVQYVSTFISGISVGLYANWRLTTVLICLSPLIIGTSAALAKVIASSAAREQLKYSLASGVADQVLMCLRTVSAFGGEPKEIKRYEQAVEDGRILVMRRYHILSISVFFIFFILYASYAVAFWYGATLIGEGISTPGSVFAVFYSVMLSAFSVGNILPYMNAVSTAMGAASNVYSIISRKPKIDSYSKEGIVPKNLEAKIEFKNVSFTYPSRTDVQVLDGMDMVINPGETVAIIGHSGSGKSTIVNLILRFYDATSGQICIGGHYIKELNLKWLRSQIGVVSQEPVLFGESIVDNIRYGKEDVTIADVEKTAKLANAHTFIKELPQGYNTQVGSRGAQLSGGQKQRIAIARALIRDPKILILDEATSALDSHSEGVVQEALDKAMVGRTTIIIAHRLSTIRNVDKIIALQNGRSVEQGTHEQLMLKKGLYYNLVTAQTLKSSAEEVFSDPEEVDGEYQFRKGSDGFPSSHMLNEDSISSEPASVKSTNYFARLTAMNMPEWLLLLVGLFACTCVGSITPVFAFFYGEFFTTFKLKGEDLEEAIKFWTVMFVLLGFLSGFSYWLQCISMCYTAEKLIARLRNLTFQNILRQEISWFDNEEYTFAKLITRLARDAPVVKSASGMRAGNLISSFVTLVAGVSIAVIFGWKLAFVLFIGVPVLIYSSYKHLTLMRGTQVRDSEFMDNAGKVATECLQNIRTVQSLGKEHIFLNKYTEFLKVPFKASKKQAIYFAFTFAVSNGVVFFIYACAFKVGHYLIGSGEMTPSEVYRVLFALSFCSAAVGTSMGYLQDWSKASMSAKLMFDILDKKSKLDPTSLTGMKPVVSGKISLKNIEFSYPSRKHVKILRGLTVTVEAGQTLALVGRSGCGKSTIISLLERFYTPDSGNIEIDDQDISELNLAHLRANIGLVTQEPDLFSCSIKENIAYGALHTKISDHDIFEAAKTANIHNFIISLPQGYDTLCGDRGTQLSGGQKQRIAIARAIVRDPKILLLDEATSALDTESEKIVQEALDRARQGRTSIIIAHRLSTIQNADKIAVIHRGRVVEEGTHEVLIGEEGYYYELTRRQMKK